MASLTRARVRATVVDCGLRRITPEPPEKRATVYIVDDADDIRDSLRWLCRSAGFEVHTCASGQALLDAYDPGRVGCLVLDVCLPDMDGVELLARLRTGGDPVPVVVMTAFGDVALAVRAMKLGAWTVFEKPYKAADLIAAISEAIAERARAYREQAVRCACADRMDRLTPRQRQVLDLLLQGKNTKAIALELGVTAKAIEGHRARIMAKLAVDCMVDLVRVAIASGMEVPSPTRV